MLDPNKLPRLQPKPADTREKKEKDAPAEQKPASFLKKKWIFLVAFVFVASYFSLCLQGEHMLRQGIYRFFKDLGQEGLGVTFNAPSSYSDLKSGIDLDDLVVSAPERMGGWVLNTGKITVTSMPLSPRRIMMRLNGTHSLKTRTIGDIRLVVERGEAELRLPSGKNPLSFRLVLNKVQAASPKSMEGFFLPRLELTVTRDAENVKNGTLRFSLTADAVHLPAFISSHLPPVAEKIDLDGVVSGVPDEPVSFLTGWLNRSGTVEIEKGDIVWPPFSARLNGTFGFNKSFEMIGAGVAKTYGFFDLLDMLQNGDYLRPRRVSVAKVVLGEQVRKDKGQTDALTAAFSIQSGKIYTGPVLLYDNHEK